MYNFHTLINFDFGFCYTYPPPHSYTDLNFSRKWFWKQLGGRSPPPPPRPPLTTPLILSVYNILQMWKSSMCESLVCGHGLHYGLHSIFKHTNELYYFNLLNDESIQKTNNKNICIDVLVE